jgi:hypothetical protein
VVQKHYLEHSVRVRVWIVGGYFKHRRCGGWLGCLTSSRYSVLGYLWLFPSVELSPNLQSTRDCGCSSGSDQLPSLYRGGTCSCNHDPIGQYADSLQSGSSVCRSCSPQDDKSNLLNSDESRHSDQVKTHSEDQQHTHQRSQSPGLCGRLRTQPVNLSPRYPVPPGLTHSGLLCNLPEPQTPTLLRSSTHPTVAGRGTDRWFTTEPGLRDSSLSPPPISLIPLVLQKIKTEQIHALLVVPFWPGHSWWSSLAPFIRDIRILGPAKDILTRGPSSNPRLTNLPPGDLAMCLISSCQ